MKHLNLIGILFLCTSVFGQDVRYDYDRAADFNSFKTYQWVDRYPVAPGDQLLDQDIKRAVDSQLAGKGLRRVESDGDLQVSYQGGISQEKQYDYLDFGPRWWGDSRVTTSTIEVGQLVVVLMDRKTGHLAWRGFASKTLDLKRDPDKNYHNLEKAMAKLFRNYPPDPGKR